METVDGVNQYKVEVDLEAGRVWEQPFLVYIWSVFWGGKPVEVVTVCI